MKSKYFLAGMIALQLIGCGVDKNSAEYDQRRYDELQRANCNEMASVLSAPFVMETPEEFDAAYKRCQDLKSLTFEQYMVLAEHGRQTGVWDVYAVYPEKR